MFAIKTLNPIKSSIKSSIKLNSILTNSMKNWPVPPKIQDIRFPDGRELEAMEPIPTPPNNTTVMKLPRRHYDMRGPELIHNQLIYKQYGVIALTGGQLKATTIEAIRQVVNKKLDSRMFAVWRIDPPWKAVVKKRLGKKGGGKAPIHHYVTPVRAGRIILEVGGTIEFDEVRYFLLDVVGKLPLEAIPIDQQGLEDLKREEDELKASNINPITLDRVFENNLCGAKNNIFTSLYEHMWHTKYK